MPVFLITFHAYRSWTEDNPAGYYQRGQHGVQQSNPDLAIRRSRIASSQPIRFTHQQQSLIIDQLPEVAARRALRLYGASCTPSHVHVVISWFGQEGLIQHIEQPRNQAHAVANKIKNILAMLLSKQDGTTGNRWFSRGCDCTPVEDLEHLNHLLSAYLPKHALEEGMVRIFDKGNTTP